MQFRNGKLKNRGTGDLGLHGLFEAHSTNSGWDLLGNLYEFPELEYMTSAMFARDCGVVITAYDVSTSFEIRKNDWKGPCQPVRIMFCPR